MIPWAVLSLAGLGLAFLTRAFVGAALEGCRVPAVLLGVRGKPLPPQSFALRLSRVCVGRSGLALDCAAIGSGCRSG